MSEENNGGAIVQMNDASDARRRASLAAVQSHHMATTVASLCTEIVVRTAVEIQGNKYVPAASWEAIAAAHGCVVGTEGVKFIPKGENSEVGGFRATGIIRDAKSGQEIARAEGFVGMDEHVWFGGEAEVWSRKDGRLVKKKYPKRSEFAIRAMAQTRAAGRVCKQAFAHVVVMMDKGLSTTPAEEIPTEPEDPDTTTGKKAPQKREDRRQRVAAPSLAPSESEPEAELPVGDWRDVRLHWPKELKGQQLGEQSTARLEWYHSNFQANLTPEDRRLRTALDQWQLERGMKEGSIPA